MDGVKTETLVLIGVALVVAYFLFGRRRQAMLYTPPAPTQLPPNYQAAPVNTSGMTPQEAALAQAGIVAAGGVLQSLFTAFGGSGGGGSGGSGGYSSYGETPDGWSNDLDWG